jgi:hypothetical protein
MIMWIRILLLEVGNDSTSYFWLLRTVGTVIFHLDFHRIQWFKQRRLKDVINFLYSSAPNLHPTAHIAKGVSVKCVLGDSEITSRSLWTLKGFHFSDCFVPGHDIVNWLLRRPYDAGNHRYVR